MKLNCIRIPALAATIEPDRPVVLGFTVEITEAVLELFLRFVRAIFGSFGITR